MSGALRSVMLVTVAVGLFLAVAILAWTRVDANRESAGTKTDIRPSSSASSAALAARYHQRKRTQRFFDRVKRSSPTTPPSAGLLTPRGRGRHVEATVVDDRWLAGRYHQRKRTSRFFKRRVG